MFKSLLTLVVTLGAVSFAQATSLHPCTPFIHAQPSYLSCKSGSDFVSITIDIYMSDRQICPADQVIEKKTAFVEITNSNDELIKKLTIPNNDFSYDLDGYFKSEKNGLDLTGCISPMHGGVSFGN